MLAVALLGVGGVGVTAHVAVAALHRRDALLTDGRATRLRPR
jgi:hypothetical protein